MMLKKLASNLKFKQIFGALLVPQKNPKRMFPPGKGYAKVHGALYLGRANIIGKQCDEKKIAKCL